jgi:hypothetical protein
MTTENQNSTLFIDEEIPDELLDINLTLPFPYVAVAKIKDNEWLIQCDAIDLIENIQVWDRQRIIQETHVREIVQYQEAFHRENGDYNFVGIFYICGINDKDYRIIDGQHRLAAMNHLSKKNPENSFRINVWVTSVKSEIDRIQLFQNINLSRPVSLSDLLQDEESNIINSTAEYFYKKYKSFFSDTNLAKPRRPNMKLDVFKNELLQQGVVHILGIRTHKELIRAILETNEYYSSMDPELFPQGNTNNNKKMVLLIQKKGGLYLGMYPDYSWINKMVEQYRLKQKLQNKIEAPEVKGEAQLKDDKIIAYTKSNESFTEQDLPEFDDIEEKPKEKKKQTEQLVRKFVLAN